MILAVSRERMTASSRSEPNHDGHQLLDVAVGQEFIVAVQHATASYQGRRLDITGCQLMRLEHGRIAEVRGHYSDQDALDAFWVIG
jgi:hypothetical protein